MDWQELAGYEEQKRAIEDCLLLPLQHPEVGQEHTHTAPGLPTTQCQLVACLVVVMAVENQEHALAHQAASAAALLAATIAHVSATLPKEEAVYTGVQVYDTLRSKTRQKGKGSSRPRAVLFEGPPGGQLLPAAVPAAAVPAAASRSGQLNLGHGLPSVRHIHVVHLSHTGSRCQY
jgi:hypothetical protein